MIATSRRRDADAPIVTERGRFAAAVHPVDLPGENRLGSRRIGGGAISLRASGAAAGEGGPAARRAAGDRVAP